MVEVRNNGHQNDEKNDPTTEIDEDWEHKPTLTRESFITEFDTLAYLKDFYAKVDDPAMQMVVKFLPGIAARLPAAETLLDFGAGPTIHVSICFRKKVEKIYMADYLPQNRAELQRWLEGRNNFDWTKTLQMVATSEGTDWMKIKEMEPETRSRIAGIFHCDCLSDEVVQAQDKIYGTIGIVVTIFTLEYCCLTPEEYKAAIRRVASLVKEGGYFIMGGILEETWCSFGGRKFSCLYITKDFMLECLKDAGLIINFGSSKDTLMYEINGMFLIAAKKASTN
jgi:hypothetical protein